MSPRLDSTPRRVGIVGGGLAGLAAAAALCSHGFDIQIFESKRQLGGRAGSFLDPASGEQLDHCQHVGMACCTNLLDFCERVGVSKLFERHERLTFVGPDGEPCLFEQSSWLPAPLHLVSSFWRMRFLPTKDRLAIASALWQLMRMRGRRVPVEVSVAEWLAQRQQSELAVRRFWSVILVSALGEQLDRVSLSAARKVFLDGFLRVRGAYSMIMPSVPLSQIYDQRVARWLREQGVQIHLETRVHSVEGEASGVSGIRLADQRSVPLDHVVLALPWRSLIRTLSPPIRQALPELERLGTVRTAPITAVHLWFDRRLTEQAHVVLVDRLSQWVFCHAPDRAPGDLPDDAWYCQVVISASHELEGRDRQDICNEVLNDLASIWPTTKQAHLLRWRVVTEHEAVFSCTPQTEAARPNQMTSVANLVLAGDWTNTGWPATMEGAVRSGYLAAEAILATEHRDQSRVVLPELEPGWIARRLIR